MANLDNDLYREDAVKHASSPEQLDQLLQVTYPSAWLALISICIFLFVILLWSIFGKTIITINAPCILFPASGGPVTINAEEEAYIINFKSVPGNIQKTNDPLMTLKPLHTDQGFTPYNTVYAPSDGRLLDYLANPGELITPGEPIALFQPYSNNQALIAHAFIAPNQGKIIKTGMMVNIALDQANPAQYGYIQGKVINLSDYPSTQLGLMRILQNHDLVKMMSKNGAPYEALIELAPDSQTPSGYHWTSHANIIQKIDSGSLGTAHIIIQSQAPITLAIPALSNLLGE